MVVAKNTNAQMVHLYFPTDSLMFVTGIDKFSLALTSDMRKILNGKQFFVYGMPG